MHKFTYKIKPNNQFIGKTLLRKHSENEEYRLIEAYLSNDRQCCSIYK